MDENMVFVEIPYLDEISRYLPIKAEDRKDVAAYLENITSFIALNYNSEQYQFAYFGLHLLFMTYIYFTVWKTSKIYPDRYRDAILLARGYSGRSKEEAFANIDSVFDYSDAHEKEIPRILKIIGLTEGHMSNITGLVNERNEMAHASGEFTLLTEGAFGTNASTMYTTIQSVHRCMEKQIRTWYINFLQQLCRGEFADYADFEDLILEKMIQGFNLSVMELLVCNEMSLKTLISENPHCKDKLKQFKTSLEQYCIRNGYLTEQE